MTDASAREPGEDAPADQEGTAESVSELLDQLGRDTRALILAELTATASEHAPQVRRAGRDLSATLLVGLAFLTAFALANWAAVSALSQEASGWRAPLILAVAWVIVGIAAALFVRASLPAILRWPRPSEVPAYADARAQAEHQVRETLKRLTAALAHEAESRIVTAVVPVAGGVVKEGEEALEITGGVIEEMAADLPGGGVVDEAIGLALLPGRLGVRVVTYVFRRPDKA